MTGRIARLTLLSLSLIAIALFAGGIVNGLPSAASSPPAVASRQEASLAGATIPNLTLVKARVVTYHDSGE